MRHTSHNTHQVISILRSLRRLVPCSVLSATCSVALGLVLGVLVSGGIPFVHAVTTQSGIPLPAAPGGLPDPFGTGGAEKQVGTAIKQVISMTKYLLYTLGITAFIVSALRMTIFGDNESEVKKSQTHLLYAAIGLAIIAASDFLVTTIFPAASPVGANTAGDTFKTTVSAVFDPLVTGVKFFSVGVAAIIIAITGVQMVTSTDPGKQAKGKTTLLYAVIGLATIFAVEPFVKGFYGGSLTAATYAPAGTFTDLLGTTYALGNQQIFVVITAIRYLIAAVAVVTITVNGIQMVLADKSASKHAEEWMKIMWTMIGLAVILVSTSLVKTFLARKVDIATGKVDGAAPKLDAFLSLGTSDLVASEIFEIIKFLSYAGTVIAVLMIVIAGVRMVASGGGDDAESAKKTIGTISLGLIIMTLANVVVGTIYSRAFASNPVAGGSAATLAENLSSTSRLTSGLAEMAGFLNWVLGFVGALAVVTMIYSGYQLVLGGGGNDGNAKKTLVAGGIGLALTLSAYGIVATFLPG